MWGCKECPFPASCSPSAPPHYSTSLSSPLSFSLQTFSAFTIFSTLLNWSPPAFIIVCFYIFFSSFLSIPLLPLLPTSPLLPVWAGPCQGLCLSPSFDMLLIMVRSGNTTLCLSLSISSSSSILLTLFPVRMSPCCQMEKINRMWALWRLSV